ncbi:hypothetical protein T01_8007 [Trichinella spiralis]|uniref:Uncharacterized protein n=1 Tax=Trichinella spiralis TaxID=6334 RepID=A0A0V1BLJ5_TRISP|nr:hypothetical protein T01_8007 [Trichinella spiralis]
MIITVTSVWSKLTRKINSAYHVNNIENYIIMNGMNRLLTGMINEQHILQQSPAHTLVNRWMDGRMDAYMHGTLMASPTSGTDSKRIQSYNLYFVDCSDEVGQLFVGDI